MNIRYFSRIIHVTHEKKNFYHSSTLRHKLQNACILRPTQSNRLNHANYSNTYKFKF